MRKQLPWGPGLALAGIVLFLCFPGPVRAGVQSGLSLSVGVLVPALFPVSVLAGCLIQTRGTEPAGPRAERWMNRLFGLPGSAALPLLLGILGGFPLGAQLSASACDAGLLNRKQAARLAGLSCNAGPAFLLGAAGSLLGSPALGAALLLIQLLSCLLAGILLSAPSLPSEKGSGKSAPPRSLGAVLPQCLESGTLAMVRLTGTVCFFQAAYSCLNAVLPLRALPPFWQAGISGALELTGGLNLLRETDPRVCLPLAALLIGWGGLCVYLQAAESLSRAGISTAPYLRQKGLQAGISALLALTLTGVFPDSFPAPALVAGAALCVLLFFAIRKKRIWKSKASVL